jgi:hypothetical protein
MRTKVRTLGSLQPGPLLVDGGQNYNEPRLHLCMAIEAGLSGYTMAAIDSSPCLFKDFRTRKCTMAGPDGRIDSTIAACR